MWKGLLDLEGFMWDGSPGMAAANDENRNLDKSLKEKKMEVQRLANLLDSEGNTGKNMDMHHENLSLEKKYIQQLKNTCRHEVGITENAEKLTARERSRLNQSINDIKKDIEILKSRMKNQEGHIVKQTETCNALKAALHWEEEEAVQKWLHETAEMEKDKIALGKYMHQDETKIKDLNLLLGRFSVESKHTKLTLDETDTEVFIAQSELGKTQEDYKKAHDERQYVISNWENVLQQLQKRNEELEESSKRIATIQDVESRKLNDDLAQQKLLLASELNNNRELERKISDKENFYSKLRLSRNAEKKREMDLDAELETSKNIAMSLYYRKKNIQNKILDGKKKIESIDKRLDDANKVVSNLQEMIDKLTKQAFKEEHYTQELEERVQVEQSNLTTVENEFAHVQNAIRKYILELKDLHLKEKSAEADLKGTKVSSKNLLQKIRKIDQERVEQQKLLSGISIIIKSAEQRIRVMEGEIGNDESKFLMEHEKNVLQVTLDFKLEENYHLAQNLKLMREKITAAIKLLSTGKLQKKDLSANLNFLEFFINNTDKVLKTQREKKDMLLVDEGMATVQLLYYQNLLRKQNITVVDLQRKHIEFEASTKERVLELKGCKDMLQSEVKKEEEECYQTKRQVQECANKCEKLQTRYEVLLHALGLAEIGENPQIDVLTKAEDEKRDLLHKRKQLINDVLKKENDYQGLRNFLFSVQATNEQFRQMLNPPGLTTEESEGLKDLERKQHTQDFECFKCIQHLQELDESITETENRLNKVISQLHETEVKLVDKQNILGSFNKDLENLKQKLRRADKSNSQAISEAVATYGEKSVIKKDLKLHMLREFRKISTVQLFEIVDSVPELTDKVKTMFVDSQLPLPPRRTSMSGRSSRSNMSLSQLLKKEIGSARSTPTGSEHSKPDRSILTPSVVSLGSDLSDQLSSLSVQSAQSSRSLSRVSE